jgi:hypothetical protein
MTSKAQYPNVVQATLDSFCAEAGLVKRSGSWYQRLADAGTVVNLQKSNYSGQGFLNVAVWFEPSELGPFPKENQCPIRTRLELLVAPDVDLPGLLDADSKLPVPEHAAALRRVLDEYLTPVLAATSSLEQLRTSEAGKNLIDHSLIKPAARRLIDQSTIESSQSGG